MSGIFREEGTVVLWTGKARAGQYTRQYQKHCAMADKGQHLTSSQASPNELCANQAKAASMNK